MSGVCVCKDPNVQEAENGTKYCGLCGQWWMPDCGSHEKDNTGKHVDNTGKELIAQVRREFANWKRDRDAGLLQEIKDKKQVNKAKARAARKKTKKHLRRQKKKGK